MVFGGRPVVAQGACGLKSDSLLQHSFQPRVSSEQRVSSGPHQGTYLGQLHKRLLGA